MKAKEFLIELDDTEDLQINPTFFSQSDNNVCFEVYDKMEWYYLKPSSDDAPSPSLLGVVEAKFL